MPRTSDTIPAPGLKSSQVSQTASLGKKSTLEFQQAIESRQFERKAKLEADKARRSTEKNAAMAKAEEERKKVLEEEKKLQKAAQEDKVRERERKEAARMKAEEVEKKAVEEMERAGLHRERALLAKAVRGLRLMVLAHDIGMGRAADWHRQRILRNGLNNLVLELQERWRDKRRAVLEREEQAEFDYLKNAKK